MLELIKVLGVVLGVLIAIYVMVRLGSVAWFRSRKEHIQQLSRMLPPKSNKDGD